LKYYKNIKVLVFDFDGVILDTSLLKSKTFYNVFKLYPNFLNKMWIFHLENKGSSRKMQFDYLVRNLLGESGSKANKHVKKLMLVYKKKVLPRLLKAKYIEGVLKTIKFSVKKYPLYVVSNAPKDEIKLIIEQKKIGKYFKKIYSSMNSLNKSKILNQILEIENIPSKNLLFIGDTLKDQISAKESKVKFVGIINNMSNYIDYGIKVNKIDEIYN